MRHLLDNSLWLLMPGPREEERSTGSAVASLLLAVFFAFNVIFFDSYGLVPDFMEPSFGAPIDRPAVLFFVTILLLFSALHALPPHRSRARMGARVALTLTVLAFVVWFPLARMGGYGAPVAALLVLTLLYTNHFFNRRRALRSLDPPMD